MNAVLTPFSSRRVHPSWRLRRRAFTLIEVLVVVAIIALLIAILLPALGRARAQTRLSVCGSNLRQVGVAMNLFAHDHKGLVPRGLSRHSGGMIGAEAPNWVRMVTRMFGDKVNYAANFNRVPVEKYAIFSCPERRREYGAVFLDYVINSSDHRGPITLNPCQPNPTSGSWYEVEGVSTRDVWRFPADTIYVMDAVEESWNISDPNNQPWGTMRGIRENIEVIRQPVLPSVIPTGLDWFDMAGGRNFPTYQAFLLGARFPRAALKMHLGLGSNAVYVDGHVGLVRPPPQAAGAQAIHEFYMRQLGVERSLIPGSTALGTTAADHPCVAGDRNWRP
jgi:prepilin-type N-terminal cleavage/methylation domain-containing protein/prepilin-type processing-associated H-X9-DG protein